MKLKYRLANGFYAVLAVLSAAGAIVYQGDNVYRATLAVVAVFFGMLALLPYREV